MKFTLRKLGSVGNPVKMLTLKSCEYAYPLVMTDITRKMAMEIVDFPTKKGDMFHSYVKLPEGVS